MKTHTNLTTVDALADYPPDDYGEDEDEEEEEDGDDDEEDEDDGDGGEKWYLRHRQDVPATQIPQIA